jgi:uncharacterized membrane protein
MKKSQKIIYWISTIWLSLGMFSTGLTQLLKQKESLGVVVNLGYPEYFLDIIGVWKILGVLAILLPKYALVKEWAYAGFFFCMSGAIYSHFKMNSPGLDYFGPTLLLVLTIVSWYFRPAERKLV